MEANTLITECAADLFDPDYDRWRATEDWLVYLNAGQRQVVFFKPTAKTITAVYQLVAGIKQTLPDGTSSYQDPASQTLAEAVELIDIKRNMGSDGTTPGASIFPVNPKDLDDTVPDWRSATEAATVLNFMFDPNQRTRFEVYPPQPSSGMGWVEVIYSAIPAELPNVNTDISLKTEYAEPLKNYMKYRAFAVDAQNSRYAHERALDHYNLFLTQIGRKDLIERRLPTRRGSHGNTDQPVPQ